MPARQGTSLSGTMTATVAIFLALAAAGTVFFLTASLLLSLLGFAAVVALGVALGNLI
jgi:hypothetical protein